MKRISFSFGLNRFFAVSRSRKEFFAVVEIGARSSPKAIHKVVIRAERRKGMAGAPDEGSKDAVRFKPGDPFGKGRRSKSQGK